jgi:hypothetical protein
MAFTGINFPDRDAVTRMVSRTLLQFRESPVFLDVVDAFSLELQRLLDMLTDVQKKRTAFSAGTAQLDAIGRIVGQPRAVSGYSPLPYFAPDIPEVGDPDIGLVWVETAPLSEVLDVDNPTLLSFIEARTQSNKSIGSVPEIQAAAKTVLGLDISIIIVNLMTVKIVVPDTTTAAQILFLQTYFDTKTADRVTFLPLPATVKISRIVKLSDL